MVGASLHMAENDFTEERQRLQVNRFIAFIIVEFLPSRAPACK